MQDLANKYGIGERTLRRKNRCIKKKNQMILKTESYMIFVNKQLITELMEKKMNFELQRKIDELEIQERRNKKQDDKEKRRQQLLQIEKKL